MLKTLAKKLKDESVSGYRLVGCRRSGKSYIAEQLYEELEKKADILDASSLLYTVHPTNKNETMKKLSFNLIDNELLVRLESFKHKTNWTLIIDNAEIIIAYASDKVLQNIFEILKRNRIKMVLIRNRFVNEINGYLSKRESIFEDILPKQEIGPLSGEEGLSYLFTG